jgi:hypothetical protein
MMLNQVKRRVIENDLIHWAEKVGDEVDVDYSRLISWKFIDVSANRIDEWTRRGHSAHT